MRTMFAENILLIEGTNESWYGLLKKKDPNIKALMLKTNLFVRYISNRFMSLYNRLGGEIL